MGYKVGLTETARDDLGAAVRFIAVEGNSPEAIVQADYGITLGDKRRRIWDLNLVRAHHAFCLRRRPEVSAWHGAFVPHHKCAAVNPNHQWSRSARLRGQVQIEFLVW